MQKSGPAGSRSTAVSSSTSMPAVTGEHLLTVPSSYQGFRYNVAINFSDGTSVVGDMVDQHQILLYSPGGTVTLWDMEWTLGTDNNVYLTASKLAYTSNVIVPTPTSTAQPATPQPVPSKGCGLKNVCGNGILQTAVVRPMSVACTVSAAVGLLFGTVVGAAATEATLVTAGAVVGALAGPEGALVGAEFSQYAINALGLTTWGATVGGAVGSVIGEALCEAFTPDLQQNSSGQVPTSGYPVESYPNGGPPVVITPAGGGTATVSCCYPVPTPNAVNRS